MNEQKFFHELYKLALACGYSINEIAKDCNIKQDLVAKTFMELMQTILDKMKK